MRSFALLVRARAWVHRMSATISEEVADIHRLAGIGVLLEQLHRSHRFGEAVHFGTVLRTQTVVREAIEEGAIADPFVACDELREQDEEVLSHLEEVDV